MNNNEIKHMADVANAENNNSTQDQQEKVNIFTCDIDYKNVQFLKRFVSERGKIIPSRISNQPVKRQREIAKAIKRARLLALMPFVAD